MSRNYTYGAGEATVAGAAVSFAIFAIITNILVRLPLWLHKHHPKRVAAYTGIGTVSCLPAAVALNYFGDGKSDLDMILAMLLMCALFVFSVLFIFHLIKSALPKYKQIKMGKLDARFVVLFLMLPIVTFAKVLATIAGYGSFFVGIVVFVLPFALIMLAGHLRYKKLVEQERLAAQTELGK